MTNLAYLFARGSGHGRAGAPLDKNKMLARLIGGLAPPTDFSSLCPRRNFSPPPGYLAAPSRRDDPPSGPILAPSAQVIYARPGAQATAI